jgi:hypothetical protein
MAKLLAGGTRRFPRAVDTLVTTRERHVARLAGGLDAPSDHRGARGAVPSGAGGECQSSCRFFQWGLLRVSAAAMVS